MTVFFFSPPFTNETRPTWQSEAEERTFDSHRQCNLLKNFWPYVVFFLFFFTFIWNEKCPCSCCCRFLLFADMLRIKKKRSLCTDDIFVTLTSIWPTNVDAQQITHCFISFYFFLTRFLQPPAVNIPQLPVYVTLYFYRLTWLGPWFVCLLCRRKMEGKKLQLEGGCLTWNYMSRRKEEMY